MDGFGLDVAMVSIRIASSTPSGWIIGLIPMPSTTDTWADVPEQQ